MSRITTTIVAALLLGLVTPAFAQPTEELPPTEPVPEIGVSRSDTGADLTSGVSTIDLGGKITSKWLNEVRLLVRNEGTANLTVSTVSFDGKVNVGVNNFSVTSKIAPGGVMPLKFTYLPGGPGKFSFTIHIHNDDPDEYDFTITCFGVCEAAPEIDMSYNDRKTGSNSTYVDSGDTIWVDLDYHPNGEVEISILNKGDADLTISSWDFTPVGVNLKQPPATTVQPNQSTTMNVSFILTTYTTLRVFSNDSNESPYLVTIRTYRSGAKKSSGGCSAATGDAGPASALWPVALASLLLVLIAVRRRQA